MNNNKKSRKILINGIILAAADLLLMVYFTLDSLWSIATVLIALLIAGVSGLQFWIFYEFFNKGK